MYVCMYVVIEIQYFMSIYTYAYIHIYIYSAYDTYTYIIYKHIVYIYIQYIYIIRSLLGSPIMLCPRLWV
jgi:hypothetical protein